MLVTNHVLSGALIGHVTSGPVVSFALGVDWPGAADIGLAAVLVMGFAAAAACWGVVVALRFRTQQATPIISASR